jgi:hypothetical protein
MSEFVRRALVAELARRATPPTTNERNGREASTMTDEHEHDGPDIDRKRLAAYEARPVAERREIRTRARKYVTAILRTPSVKANLTLLFQDPRDIHARRHDIVTVLLREDTSGDLAALELPERVIGQILHFVLWTQGIAVTSALRFVELSGEEIAALSAKKAEREILKAKERQEQRAAFAARASAQHTNKQDKQK